MHDLLNAEWKLNKTCVLKYKLKIIGATPKICI